MPRYSESSLIVAPSLLMWMLYHLSSAGIPSMISALMPSLSRFCAAVPPALLSLMPPVRGLLKPAERRPEFAAAVAVKRPGENTSLLYLPNGAHIGGTSLATTVDVRARPPRAAHSAGTASTAVVRV